MLEIPAAAPRGPCDVTLAGIHVHDIDLDRLVALRVALGRIYGVPWYEIEVV